MFTGIIEEKGRVCLVRKQGACVRLEVECNKAKVGAKIGDSIAVNGVCLTAVSIKENVLCFDVMPESIETTTLKNSRIGDKVNLERALKMGDRIGGHFVSGHVDCVGVIRARKTVRGSLEFHIGLPSKFLKFVVRKGSIALDGISLTIVDKKSGGFSVAIIPLTASQTTLGAKHSSDKVNVELDMLAKLSTQPIYDKLIR